MNESIAILSNSIVITEIINEKQRENEFKTWALIPEPVLVNPKGLQLQVLYVVQGKSVYTSRLLKLSWIIGSTLVLLVGGMTLYTCIDVLKKFELIKEKNKSPIPLLNECKALDMSKADYMELLYVSNVDGNSTSMANSNKEEPISGDTNDAPTRTRKIFKRAATL